MAFDPCPSSPAPGNYAWQPPLIFEDDLDLEELDEILQQVDSDTGELEVSPEQAAIYRRIFVESELAEDAKRKDPVTHSKNLKAMMRASKVLNFDKKLTASSSVSSYESDDYMSQPSQTDFANDAEYMQAIKDKAKRAKKLRLLLAGSPQKSPPKQQVLSESQRRASATIEALQCRGVPVPAELARKASPKKGKSPAKKFAALQLDSSDSDEAIPLPKTSFKPSIKKNFFAAPNASSPSPIKAAPKKSFFKPIVASDSSDEDLGMYKYPSPAKVQPKKKFFGAPKVSSPNKYFGKIDAQDLYSYFKKHDAQVAASQKSSFINIQHYVVDLNQRVKDLQQMALGEQIYSEPKLVPENIQNFLKARKGTAGYLQLAVDLETLVLESMITYAANGCVDVDPRLLLKNAKDTLKERYNLLSANLSAC